MPIPGIGIGIGIDSLVFRLGLESNMALGIKQIFSSTKSLTHYMFYQYKSGPILCKYRYKRSLLSYLWTSPYKGKGINIRIYQQLPESKWSRNRPEMVRIGIGIESCLSLESVSVSESVQCWTRYQYRNRDRKSWYRRLLVCTI